MSAGVQLLAAAPPQSGIRRLPSVTATREDLVRGPSVVVPPKDMMAPSDGHETAATMEMAKYHLDDIISDDSAPPTPAEVRVTDKFAYAFDIDGVLIRGGKPIPEAIEAMKMLNGQNELDLKVYGLIISDNETSKVLTTVVHTSSSPMAEGRLRKNAACS